MAQATGYSISPAPVDDSIVALGSTIALPMVFSDAGAPSLGAPLIITGTLSAGLQGLFTTTTPGVTIAGTVITCPIGNYSAGTAVALSFIPTAVCVDGTLTFTHTGGGAGFTTGGDPGPFAYTVTSVLPVQVIPDYIVAWEPEQLNYVAGETPLLQFAITRQDLQYVPPPIAGTLTLTAPNGTLQTSSTPFISSGIPAPQINIGVNTFAFSSTLTGTYLVEVSGITFAGTDVQIRSDLQQLQVNLAYDPTTPLGETRLWILDTDLQQPFFSDPEINVFLKDASQNTILAAVYALQVLATDQARLLQAITIGAYKSQNAVGTQSSIASRVDWLLDHAVAIAPVVIAMGSTTQSAPLPVFTTDDLSSPDATQPLPNPATDSSQGGTTTLW